MQKTILITGCSSGIGLCCAEGLHKRGYQVFATARKSEDLKKLQELGLEAISLDINNPDSIQKALETVLQKTHGQLDALFNNCGMTQPGAIEDLTREAIRQQFETNVFGPMELTAQVLKIMLKQNQGRIIFNGSLLGYVTLPLRGAYNASKFALEGFVDTLRQELHGLPIYVSLIEPGPIHTKIRENAKDNFLKYIDYQKSRHQQTYEKMADDFFKIAAKTPFYLPPKAVLKKLILALESKRPKARYHVGFPSHLLMYSKRLLPTRLLDWVMWQLFRREIK